MASSGYRHSFPCPHQHLRTAFERPGLFSLHYGSMHKGLLGSIPKRVQMRPTPRSFILAFAACLVLFAALIGVLEAGAHLRGKSSPLRAAHTSKNGDEDFSSRFKGLNSTYARYIQNEKYRSAFLPCCEAYKHAESTHPQYNYLDLQSIRDLPIPLESFRPGEDAASRCDLCHLGTYGHLSVLPRRRVEVNKLAAWIRA